MTYSKNDENIKTNKQKHTHQEPARRPPSRHRGDTLNIKTIRVIAYGPMNALGKHKSILID